MAHVPDISNRFRRALAGADRPLIGAWSMLDSFNVTESLGWAGFDWMVIDGEHGPVELADAMHHLRILDATPTAPIVRLCWNDPILLKRHLDAGVGSFMLPFVQSAQEARAAVDAMHYPPRGSRGMAGGHRASRFGHVPDYFNVAADSLFLICQIETAQALENMEDILAVEGVDAVFFGPSDLSASLGEPGAPTGDMVTRAILDARDRAAKSGKFVGVLGADDAQSETFIAAGFDFVSVAIDAALLARGATAAADRFRATAGG